MRVAVYRCLYGADFIQESIRSVLHYVDRVMVFLAPRPWGQSQGVVYNGQMIWWPKKFDDIRDRILALNEKKVEIVDDYFPTPFGQYEHIVNNFILPRFLLLKDILFMEPDWVFSKEEAEKSFAMWEASDSFAAQTRQVELWKTPAWRVPERDGRSTPTFYRALGTWFKSRDTLDVLDVTVHNLGFCYSEATMRWKHLTAMAFAKEIGDTAPNVEWFEKKWLAWDPVTNNENLEIALGCEHKIPRAVPYDVRLLPESIRSRYGL